MASDPFRGRVQNNIDSKVDRPTVVASTTERIIALELTLTIGKKYSETTGLGTDNQWDAIGMSNLC